MPTAMAQTPPADLTEPGTGRDATTAEQDTEPASKDSWQTTTAIRLLRPLSAHQIKPDFFRSATARATSLRHRCRRRRHRPKNVRYPYGVGRPESPTIRGATHTFCFGTRPSAFPLSSKADQTMTRVCTTAHWKRLSHHHQIHSDLGQVMYPTRAERITLN